MTIHIQWKNDCHGKKDYDAGIVELSSRFYPQGGGFLLLTSDGEMQENDARPHIKPTANSSIYFGDEALVTERFEGETEAEVIAKVENWAATQIAKVEAAVRAAFAT